MFLHPRNAVYHRFWLLFTTGALLLIAALSGTAGRAADAVHATDTDILWTTRVEPILERHCLKCHAGVRQQGGLDLRSLDTILRGGQSGPEIAPGKPAESRILKYVLPGAEEHMPPDPKPQLAAEEIAVLRTWIGLLPAPASRPASAADATWTAAYLAAYRKAHRSHEVAPAGIGPSAAIDWFLKADWSHDKIQPALPCSDAAFVRRIYLDLAGRIPSVFERSRFLSDPRKDRRTRLINALLLSEEYPRRMRELFDVILMGRPGGGSARSRTERGWYAYLEGSFRANRPWDQMVRDMLVARAEQGPAHGADWFLAERNNSYQTIAEAVAPVVFGVQIKCAQCHNHPLSWEIEQRHYWGLVAVFNRSKNVDTETGPGVAESATGGFINFANLKKESQPATLVFLNGKSVPEKAPAPNEKVNDSPDLYLVPPPQAGQRPHSPAVPRFSRRGAFAEAATRDNPALARAFVNRLWAALMGRGIVVPVDQIDSRHRPSHPELLDWLSHDFEQSGYNIKRLVAAIVSSRAYQLDSKPAGKTPPRPDSFARALDKPLTAEQLLRSLWTATETRPEPVKAAEIERTFVAAFPDVMPDTYAPSLQQALFLTNSPVMDDMLGPSPGSTSAKLLAIKSTEGRVRSAFAAALGRGPDADELKQCAAMLAAQPAENGVRSLLWALLTCAEFKVNH